MLGDIACVLVPATAQKCSEARAWFAQFWKWYGLIYPPTNFLAPSKYYGLKSQNLFCRDVAFFSRRLVRTDTVRKETLKHRISQKTFTTLRFTLEIPLLSAKN
jgi:hypothetical protein